MRLTLKPIGPVPPDVLAHLRASLSDFDEIVVASTAPLPTQGLDPERSQWRASSLFPDCLAESGARVVGLTEADLYEVGLNFVFGYSQPNGRVAVISLARLRTPHPGRFLERCVKEAIHEIGHTLGLGHDEDHPRCVMKFSHNLEETDRKGAAYCSDCRRRAELTLSRLRT